MAWLRFGKRRCFTRRSKSDSRRFSMVMAILAARIRTLLKYDKQSYLADAKLQYRIKASGLAELRVCALARRIDYESGAALAGQIDGCAAFTHALCIYSSTASVACTFPSLPC